VSLLLPFPIGVCLSQPPWPWVSKSLARRPSSFWYWCIYYILISNNDDRFER
jgi:hypothetical protein